MTLNETQQHYWLDRYAKKDSTGQVVETTIEETWARVAQAIASTQKDATDYERLLRDFKFVPGGRIISGAGAEGQKTFYNCFVIPMAASRPPSMLEKDFPGNDSREAIFDTIKVMVDIMSRGGGVGINWSTLRPQKAYLTKVSGTSSGPVGWMDVASTAVGEVEQGGSRRGAAMFMLDDWHPDLMRFISEKKTPGKIENANVSVAVSDRFMEAVKADEDWTFEFPDTTDEDYDSIWNGSLQDWKDSGRPVRAYDTIKASVVWAAICEAAWASGEPGVVFLDRYNKLSTAGDFERIISVNPCGEQGLGAYSVCNLGSMNLDAYFMTEEVDEGETVSGFRWGSFRNDVRTAIRFLDDVVDATTYFIRETEIQQRYLRRIGLGVMGLADILVRLGYRYGSQEAVDFTSHVFQVMKDEAIEESNLLAVERGAAYAWKDEMWEKPYLAEYVSRLGKPKTASFGMRNLFLLTQAPTGTTSLLADVNSGIEPYFQLKTWRADRTGGRYVYAKAVQETTFTTGDPEDTFPRTPDYVVTAQDVSVPEHIAMQAAVQQWVDSSVSKTINAPSSQTVEECEEAYMSAYDSGLKGLAYYRDGSRSKQVLYQEDPNVVIAGLEAKVKELAAKLAFQQRGWNTDITSPFVMTGLDRDDVCPACKVGTIEFTEGCKLCRSCGWSAC